MKYRYAANLLLPALLLSATGTSYAQTFFTARLSAAQQSHDVTSDGVGTAVMSLDEGDLHFFITVDGLTGPITAAHFHQAALGTDGGVVKTITDDFAGTTAVGVWSGSDAQALTDALIADLYAGNLYLNVHTSMFGPGEIRGQIYPSDGYTFSADLTPAQETHDVTVDARGTASVQVNEFGAAFFVSVDGLTGAISGAHFHNGPLGEDGGVERAITDDFDGTTAVGLWTANDAQPFTGELALDLLKGNLYLNVHTATNGAGEIRGQLVPSSGWGFSASLDPSQETHTVVSTAAGTAAVTLTTGGLLYDITATGLSGPITGAHFHNAPAGQDGGVVHNISANFSGNSAEGVWEFGDQTGLTEDLVMALLRGELYINLHTAANQAGEIRGQVLPLNGSALSASLTAAQAKTTSTGSGTAAMELTDAGLSFNVTVDSLSGPITNAHFHRAFAGESAGVVRGIFADFVGNTASGIWTASDAQPLNDELIAAALSGELYLNIHTAANPGGEIRGQVFASSGTALRAFLTPEQQSSSVTQDASGTATLTLTDAGLIYQVTAEGLSGPITAAHFHNNAAGLDGSVVHNIGGAFVGNTALGFWKSGETSGELTQELRDELLAGNLYINLHTDANGAGEIRGQVRTISGLTSGVEMSAAQQVNATVSDGRGTAALQFTAEGLIYDLTVSGLTGPVTNAHVHNARVGENGAVVRGIASDFLGNTAFGVWRDSDGQPFSTDMVNEFIAGNLYLNIHTEANSGGEIRGQIGPGDLVATGVEQIGEEIPDRFSLKQNYPNPFNPSTTIEFDLAQAGEVSLRVYDSIGRLVATVLEGKTAPGTYRVSFDAGRLPSGVYHYRLASAGAVQTRTMILVK